MSEALARLCVVDCVCDLLNVVAVYILHVEAECSPLVSGGCDIADVRHLAVELHLVVALNIYSTFYGSNATSPGVAQAKAVLFFILVAGLGLAQLSYTRKREVQQ